MFVKQIFLLQLGSDQCVNQFLTNSCVCVVAPLKLDEAEPVLLIDRRSLMYTSEYTSEYTLTYKAKTCTRKR